ncbi:(R)-hydratase [Roseobacter litoralis]|uniref:MaoC dehydratase-like protein n=1 Tax=Roseobacter litoralis (strain ATCC 49566 / DSM 6996 / JCM 21268 / NBRC 15278 / OCh 149) TaxID=391595 RepID=F7ZFJ0_ROSLO|nr:(R)-hydratase [Roseobacter litoralis]AEI95995.1 MaoC dehydratase-like protein [Roseobacter litoralis Och 149]
MNLSPGSYGYHDLASGDCLVTSARVITAELIDDFARVSGDTYEIHMSDAAAQAKGFERRVAHGLLVLAVIDGLKNNAPARFDALASLGWTWRFVAPVLAGDTISAKFVIREKRLTANGKRGITKITAQAMNQHGDIVQEGENGLIFDL